MTKKKANTENKDLERLGQIFGVYVGQQGASWPHWLGGGKKMAIDQLHTTALKSIGHPVYLVSLKIEKVIRTEARVVELDAEE